MSSNVLLCKTTDANVMTVEIVISAPADVGLKCMIKVKALYWYL
jgi:hypothetical protein